MQSIYLDGAEQVSSAARTMASAAQDIHRAAFEVSGALAQHQRFMDDWLARFIAALDAKEG